MQRLIYTIDISEEVYELNGLLYTLDNIVAHKLETGIIRSRLESPDEICETGEWDDDHEGL